MMPGASDDSSDANQAATALHKRGMRARASAVEVGRSQSVAWWRKQRERERERECAARRKHRERMCSAVQERRAGRARGLETRAPRRERGGRKRASLEEGEEQGEQHCRHPRQICSPTSVSASLCVCVCPCLCVCVFAVFLRRPLPNQPLLTHSIPVDVSPSLTPFPIALCATGRADPDTQPGHSPCNPCLPSTRMHVHTFCSSNHGTPEEHRGPERSIPHDPSHSLAPTYATWSIHGSASQRHRKKGQAKVLASSDRMSDYRSWLNRWMLVGIGGSTSVAHGSIRVAHGFEHRFEVLTWATARAGETALAGAGRSAATEIAVLDKRERRGKEEDGGSRSEKQMSKARGGLEMSCEDVTVAVESSIVERVCFRPLLCTVEETAANMEEGLTFNADLTELGTAICDASVSHIVMQVCQGVNKREIDSSATPNDTGQTLNARSASTPATRLETPATTELQLQEHPIGCVMSRSAGKRSKRPV
eukprot:3933394-Rhodomonas_salina.2